VHGDQVATQVYRLQHESAANLTAVLRPLISPNNSIMADPGNNSLVITDYADNLRRLSKIIAALDAPSTGDLDVVPIRNGIASDVAALVTRLMEPSPGGDAGRVTVLADPRTNTVIVRAPSAARANMAKSLIAKLDQPTTELGNIHVVYLKNADASKVAQTLRAVVSQDASAVPVQQQGTSGGSIQSAAPGGTRHGTGGGSLGGQQGQQSSVGMGGTGNTFAQQGQATAGGAGGGQGSGFIQADASTNSLIITAPDAVYRNLRSVIDQLDVRRAQVYIEALVVEVTSNDAAEFGVQWVGLTGDDQQLPRRRPAVLQCRRQQQQHRQPGLGRGAGIGGASAAPRPRPRSRIRPACRSASSGRSMASSAWARSPTPGQYRQGQHPVDAEHDHAGQRAGDDQGRPEHPDHHRLLHDRRERRKQPVPDRRPQGRGPAA
jgi:type II secretion system protein D